MRGDLRGAGLEALLFAGVAALTFAGVAALLFAGEAAGRDAVRGGFDRGIREMDDTVTHSGREAERTVPSKHARCMRVQM